MSPLGGGFGAGLGFGGFLESSLPEEPLVLLVELPLEEVALALAGVVDGAWALLACVLLA